MGLPSVGLSPDLRRFELRPPDRVREVLRLAWPAVLSYVLHNTYRINDQYWVQGLGADAQTAMGATMFVAIMCFAAMFLAVGGTLALVSRATGSGDFERRDAVTRQGLLLAVLVGLVLSAVSQPATPRIVALLGLEGGPAAFARDYLGTLLLLAVPLALAPCIDNIFIGRGNTRVPLLLQVTAIFLNYALNPVLIYGHDLEPLPALDEAGLPIEGAAFGLPGFGLARAAAAALDIEGMGMAGAALATCLSRTITSCLGLCILRFAGGVRLFRSPRGYRPTLALSIVRISFPVSMSIAVYAGAYWALLAFVLDRLPSAVTAGLGVGFQVFEGIAFPCYLGVAMAGASLIGRSLGAADPAGAVEILRSARWVGRMLAVCTTLAFVVGGPLLAPLFTRDREVLEETLRYVLVLAASQYFVAVETVNEKVLLGAGTTRPIFFISATGNILRIPLAYLLALTAGWGALGVWWAINLTTILKASLLWLAVQRGGWLRPPLQRS